MSDILYIKMDASTKLTKGEATVEDVATLKCRRQEILNQVNSIKLLTDDSGGKKRYIVSIMEIIGIVNRSFENIEIQNIGETECVVEFINPRKGKSTLEVLKTIAVCFILFFGVGFSIMSFNNDVSVDDMFGRVSEFFTGSQTAAKLLVEYCYSIGLGVGIIIFYNHFGAKKLSKDPTPIEVEMRKYESDINQTLIENYGRQSSGE